MSFQAKIKLGQVKAGPLTHTGFKGRVTKKGESFTTTSAEEATYYRAQPGFVVTVTKGKLVTPKPEELVEPDEGSTDDEEATDDEEEARPTEVKGVYERADLKKMSRDDLLLLIRNDDDVPLKLRDVPKKAGKKEIITLILDAQKAADDADEDD